jgi:hypothetical protein
MRRSSERVCGLTEISQMFSGSRGMSHGRLRLPVCRIDNTPASLTIHRSLNQPPCKHDSGFYIDLLTGF